VPDPYRGVYDYHVHSNYSDGEFMGSMLRAAADAGLDGVGFNLDATYERRRDAIADLRADYDIRVFDAVELDYHPADEAEIRAFLAEAGFDYAVGSVHELRGVNVHRDYFADLPAAERAAAVDEYFDRVVALVESELFDVAAHLDIVERNPALRGHATADHYEAVAAALADSSTVPELNAGRVDREYGELHPNAEFLSVLADHGVAVTVGSDAHTPDSLRERIPLLRDRPAAAGVDTATL
jgi:histidinol-phosphatase (PHP family)